MSDRSTGCAYCGLPVSVASSTAEGPFYCCLGCRFAAAVAQESGETGRIRWTLTRLGLSIFFSMNVMMCAMALWSRDLVSSLHEAEQELLAAFSGLLEWLCFVLTLPVLLLLGIPLGAHVVAQFRERRMTTDGLLLAGVMASFLYSTISLWRGSGPIYFEVTCMVLVAVTLGRWLEAVAKQKTRDAIDSLAGLLPDRVRRIDERGEPESVALDQVRIGDRLRWSAGDRIAVDGRVVEGRAAVDRSFLTGESEPAAVGVGDLIQAGEIDLDGTLTSETLRPVGEGALAALVERVRRAAMSKNRYQKLADRIAAVFLPLVMLAALGLFGWRSLDSDWGDAVQQSLSVVLIACPCALGLATPLAVWSALGRAARRQILVRDGESLCRLAEVQTVAFDKTGTLTNAQAVAERLVTSLPCEEVDVRKAAWRLCESSNHPHARAISQWCRSQGADGVVPGSVRTVPGLGVEGEWDGTRYRLGSAAWFDQDAYTWPDVLESERDRALRSGHAVSVIGWGGVVRGLFLMSESPREEVAQTFEALRNDGVEVVVLTGDSPVRAHATCREWGVRVHAGLLPEQKNEAIGALRSSGRAVAMVGDGLNDAPALAAADVGIAVHAASDLARQTADVCLLGHDLRCVPESLRIARKTRGAIRFNLFWAFAYNTVGVGLAVAGRLHPIVAALAMLGSSLLVVGRSLYLGHEP